MKMQILKDSYIAPCRLKAFSRSIVSAFALLLTTLPAFSEIGGGYSGNGLTGEYFANPDLTGAPSFSRRELRLDFDWGTILPIGGSNDPRYKAVPTDNFSARFTGKIIAAFTETYTFKLVANDGARLFIRPEGGSAWTTLIDQWSTAGTYTATSALVRGTRYEIKVEYRELTGTAALRLLWSSPSTPEEVIDPIMNQGFNVNFWGQCLADLAKCGRNVWDENLNGPVTQDANGWPQNDAAIVLQETMNVGLDVDPLSEGLSTFSFKGRATLGLRGNIKAGDGSDNLTYTYDAGTNTTTGTLRITPNGWNACYLLFADTDRDGQLPARKNGITDLQIMRPSTPSGSESYPAGTVFNDHARTTGAKFTALRMNLNNANGERRWTDRTTATYFNQSLGKATKNYYIYTGGVDPAPSDYNNGPSWEYCVMLANETGADLYLNPPVMADGWTPADTSSYIYKLAQLVRYGSDGVNPYTGPTANPVFPPLNPNLRVYLELSNEIWNPFGSAFRQYFDVNEMMKVDARTALGTPTADDLIDTHARPTDFAILNFDNMSTAKDADDNFVSGNTWRMRKIILRALQLSEIFRAVWGDANMGSRIRPLYEWQYEDANATASTPLKFVNDYFNNGDGTPHVATPHPVNYFFWGGGGASYYGAVNGYGTTDQLINPSFETPVVSNGYTVAPSGATWTFNGTAGIARDAGTGDDIPPGWEGSAQCGYIAGTGSMTMQITIPSTQISNTYGIVFKALNRVKAGAPIGSDGKPTPDTQKVRLYVNGVLKEWKSFSQNDGGYTPAAYDPSNPWNSKVVYWSPNTPYYSSDIFTAAPGETVTLRLEGSAAADQIAFLEDVRLASVDRTFADGMPGGGEALGQPAGAGYQTGLNIQASWAFAYGLKYTTYEGGWSLGGDTGGTPLQNTGKFLSTDAAVANTKAINMFHQSGGYLNTFGTYSLWPSWSESIKTEGLLNISAYPLIYSQDERMNNLRAEPANGVFLPNSLLIGNASLLPGGTGNVVGRNWLSWNAITTTTDDYTITINTDAGGTAQLWVDGVPLGASFTTGSAVTRSIRLTKGVHGIRLQGIAGDFALQSISFAIPNAPAAPVIGTITDGSGTKTVEWGAVAGATGYTIRWGTDSGIYLESADVPSGTSKVLTGLTHDQTYYIVVSAYNATGLSMPSAEVGSTALVDGLTGHLARWDFAGSTGNEVEPPPSSSTSRIITTGLARGPGLRLSGYGIGSTGDSFAYAQLSYPGSTTASGALSRGDYSEFTVTPKPGSTLSVSSLIYTPYWQDAAPTLDKTGIAYSINGSAYILTAVTGTPGVNFGSPLTATLSGIPALQNLTVPVTFRLLHPNVGEYSFAGIGRQAGDDIVLFGSVAVDTLTAPPVISPDGAVFYDTQAVTLSTSTPGATIRYTTDGSTPTSTSGTVYSSPFTLSATATVKAIAYASGRTDSTVSSSTFTLAPPLVAAPTFTPNATIYPTTQSVFISSATPSATIRYTTNGTTPTSTSGTIYSGALTINATTTIKAIAYAAGMSDSSVSTGVFTIGAVVPDITYQSQSTNYAVSNTDLINGVTPIVTGNTNWAQESNAGAPALNNGVFLGRATVGTNAGRDIIWNFATPQDLANIHLFFSWGDGGRDNVPIVQIYTSSTPYVLTNGSSGEAPESPEGVAAGITANGGFSLLASTVDTAPATGVNSKVTIDTPMGMMVAGVRSIYIKFGAAESGYVGCNEIDVNGTAWTTPVATPTFSPATGTYTSTQNITISSATAGATIRYTTDGSTPTSTSGTVYIGAITVATSQTLKAIAYKVGQPDSVVSNATYAINPPTALETFRSNSSLSADGSEDLLTPAGDGVANLLKYAFNMIGTVAGQGSTLATPNAAMLTANGSAGLPFVSIGTGSDSGKLQLTYIRRKASSSPGINYVVEFSNDLGVSDPWAANPSATESATSLDTTFERVTLTDSNIATRRFVRVKVTAQ